MPFASSRLSQLQPYLFARLDAKRSEAKAAGIDLIDFGIGDPDMPPPTEALSALCEAALMGDHRGYPPYRGTPAFLTACSEWLASRYGIDVDPRAEVLALIGSKEGIAHSALAFVSPGDVVLYPDPGYPVYCSAGVFAGGKPDPMPLLAHRNFLPDFSKISSETARRAAVLYLNYPNNPTGAIATEDFFHEAAAFARANEIAVCHDAAYIETVLEGAPLPCMLSACKDKRNIIEFFSFSKTFNMTGWRIAFAAGDRELIEHLARVKTNLDSGGFVPVQKAAIDVMRRRSDFPSSVNEIYRERRDILLDALEQAGIEPFRARATFYVWAKIPTSGSAEFCEHLLDECGILAAPGVAFGKFGEGYVRFSLTLPTDRVLDAAARLKRLSL